MADSDTSLFVFLIIFWTLLTIFSNVFINYLEEPISDSINDFVPDSDNIQVDNNFFDDLYNFLSEVPIINAFMPIVKILTFGYSDKIPALITIFLDATMILTYYVVWSIFKK